MITNEKKKKKGFGGGWGREESSIHHPYDYKLSVTASFQVWDMSTILNTIEGKQADNAETVIQIILFDKYIHTGNEIHLFRSAELD